MRKRHPLSPLLFALVVLALVAGCGRAGSGTPGRPPERTGSITQVNQSGATRILVEGAAAPGGNPMKISVTVTNQTRVAVLEGGKPRPATAADLQQGQTVDVWIDGPIMESYPEQATGSYVLIR